MWPTLGGGVGPPKIGGPVRSTGSLSPIDGTVWIRVCCERIFCTVCFFKKNCPKLKIKGHVRSTGSLSPIDGPAWIRICCERLFCTICFLKKNCPKLRVIASDN